MCVVLLRWEERKKAQRLSEDPQWLHNPYRGVEQLWRVGLNDHGNSFSHFFSSGIGNYCVSRQCMIPRTATSPAQMLLFRTCALSKTVSQIRPCVLNNIFKEHLNQTSYCSSLSAAALRTNSRMMFAWMGHGGPTGNTMSRNSLCGPTPLLSLSSMARFYMYPFIHSFIHSKGKQISFPMQLKKHRQQEQDPKNTSTRTFYCHQVLCLIKPQGQ